MSRSLAFMSTLRAAKRQFVRRSNIARLTVSPRSALSRDHLQHSTHRNPTHHCQHWRTWGRPEVQLIHVSFKVQRNSPGIIVNFYVASVSSGMTSPSDQYQHPPMFDPHHVMGPIPQYPYPHPSTPHPQSFPHPHQPMPSTSSAFYPPQPVHRDPMGESYIFFIFRELSSLTRV